MGIRKWGGISREKREKIPYRKKMDKGKDGLFFTENFGNNVAIYHYHDYCNAEGARGAK
jgi:hypothetical protein